MANTKVLIKRSIANTAPASLGSGELAFSYASNTLFIGSSDGSQVLSISKLASQSAYDQANTATNNAASASQYANTGINNAASASLYANNAINDAASASVYANTGINNAASASIYANTGITIAGAAFNKANDANSLAQAAFDVANNAASGSTDQYARDTANSAGIYANTAINNAASASAYANTGINNAASASQYANTAINNAASASQYANTAINNAASASTYANTGITLAGAAFDQANAANSLAQSAYDASNNSSVTVTADSGSVALYNYGTLEISGQEGITTSVSSGMGGETVVSIDVDDTVVRSNTSGIGPQTISTSLTIGSNNDLIVTGNLIITGNIQSQNVQSLEVADPLILLGVGNYVSDTKDIGFAAHYNDGVNAHAGLIRDANTDKEWYFFEGYTGVLDANNNIDITAPSFRTSNVHANYFKGNVIGTTVVANGVDLGTYVQSAYNQANTATNNAASASQYANTAINNAASASQYANTAIDNAASASAYANTGINNAASASQYANTAIDNAASASLYANTGINNAASASQYANDAITIAQAAFGQANTATNDAASASAYANTGINNAASASAYANDAINLAQAAYDQGNSTATVANTAVNNAASASLYANNAINDAASASQYANTGINNAASASLYANTGINNAASASLYANTGINNAASASAYANSGITIAGAAFDKANAANSLAQSAFDAANNVVSTFDIVGDAGSFQFSTGGTLTIIGGDGITTDASVPNQLRVNVDSSVIRTTGVPNQTINGTLAITGDLVVAGNTVTQDVQTLVVEDSLIHLAANNSVADSLDIGFYGQYASGGVKYTALMRDATDGKYKVLINGTEEPSAGNTVNVAAFSTGTLVADIEATTITTGTLFATNLQYLASPGSSDGIMYLDSITNRVRYSYTVDGGTF